MNPDVHACRQETINAFLAGTLGDSAAGELEAHLDECEFCRNALDGTVASEQDWVALRNALAGDNRHSATEIQDAQSPDTRSVQIEFCRQLLAPSDDPQMMGRLGTYEVVGLLGQGGMGVVFKGFDASLNRYVAIKLMAPHIASSGAARQRFRREAQAAAGIVHEHVIAIHGVSEWQGTPYLVMPYVRGVSLQKRIDEDGALPLRELLRIGMQIASGLAAAHAQGLIHRDVKPANVLMEDGVDRVVLTDFGLARAVDDVRLTRTDTLVGTPQYMSPEQVNDETLDFRSDLFSLGSVLYEVATGRPAFRASTSYGVLRKINDHDPAPIRELNPDIPDWFARVISRLLARDPDQRIPSAADVASLLQQCLSHVEQPHLIDVPAELTQPDSPKTTLSIRRLVMAAVVLASVAGGLSMLLPSAFQDADGKAPLAANGKKSNYSSAQEALQVGGAFYNSRNFKAAREPLEAAVKLAGDDKKLKLQAYGALLASYRLIPEFEPFRDAAEYIIAHHDQDARRSLTCTAFLSFAFNRGQMENLVKRYEKRLKKDPKDWTAVYLLSEIYSRGAGIPRSTENSTRAIALLEQLEMLNAERARASGKPVAKMTPAEAAKISREKGRLAMQYMRAKDYAKAARLYEEIAPLDSTTQAWCLKEAASAHLKLNDTKNALRLALAADKAPPEARTEQLSHFFHRNLGDTFMALDKPGRAVPHYEIAIEKTNIAGYLKDTKASLQEAKEKSGK